MKNSLLAVVITFPCFGYGITAFAEDVGDSSTESAIVQSVQQVQQRGTRLFANPIAGETYAELPGKIGHSAVDMTLEGNGLLSFELRRDFEEIPGQYPYALSTMSIRVPRLEFDTHLNAVGNKLSDTNQRPAGALQMTCTNFTQGWTDEGHVGSWELLNDVLFHHESGQTSLIPMNLIDEAYRSSFPDNALLASKDNYYLACDGDQHAVYSPNGEVYRFDAAQGGESYFARRYGGSKTHYFSHYRLHVTSKFRHNATLNYSYKSYPVLTVAGEQRPPKVRAPLKLRSSGSHNRGDFSSRRLLSTVSLAVHGVDQNKVLRLTYRDADAATCPGVLDRMTSSDTAVPEVKYGYVRMHSRMANHPGSPTNGCVLNTVKHRVNPNELATTWTFDYGIGDPAVNDYFLSGTEITPYYVFPATRDWNDYSVTDYWYLPLKSVKSPTGAAVSYTYVRRLVCNYQDSNARFKFGDSRCQESENTSSARYDNQPFRPVVTLRRIHADTAASVSSQVTNFEYEKNGDRKTVTRRILNDENMHEMTFGRINRAGFYVGSDEDINSGRLLRHRLASRSGDTQFTTDYTYKQFGNFPVYYNGTENRPYRNVNNNSRTCTGCVTGWAWFNSRSNYMRDSQRIKLSVISTKMGKFRFETHYRKYDDYGYPTEISEKQFNSVGAETARAQVRRYDNDGKNKASWFVGGLVHQQYETGGTNPLTNSYTYNTYGRLVSQNMAGVKTTYGYHTDGELHWEMDADNHKTYHTDYLNGVPQTVTTPEGGKTTFTVDKYGNIRSEKQIVSSNLTLQTLYEYDDRAHQLSKIVRSGSTVDDTVVNPTWSGSATSLRKLVITSGTKNSTTTYYDGHGRVIREVTEDKTTAEKIARVYIYDKLGRKRFISDAHDASITQNLPGNYFSYDAFGRLLNKKHNYDSESGGINYCYSASQSNCENFTGAGWNMFNGFGYAVRDEQGYETAYYYRALGSPGAAEVMNIYQDVDTPEFNKVSYSRLFTAIKRNKVGFVTSISQGAIGNANHRSKRTFTPYVWGGSLTHLLSSETHPEFDGVKTYDQYSNRGQLMTQTNHDDSVVKYQYDKDGNLTKVVNDRSAQDAASTDDYTYTYYDNGLTKSVAHGKSHWSYTFNNDGLLKSETLNVSGDNESFQTTYDYDTHLGLRMMTYPSGRKVTYVRDGLGRASSIDNFVQSISYHASGAMTGYQTTNGFQFSADLDNRQRPQKWELFDDNTTHFNLFYHYTKRGNIEKIDRYFPVVSSTEKNTSLTNLQYDGMNRLVRADGAWGIAQYSYNPYGGIDKKHVGGENLELDYDHANRKRLKSYSVLTTSDSSGTDMALGDYPIAYDKNGNITDNGRVDSIFDHRNRMIKTVHPSFTHDYTYDGNDMRYRSNVVSDDGSSTSTTYYVYSASGQLVHEKDTHTGETRDHVFLNGQSIATVGIHHNADSDDDGIPDYIEHRHGLDAAYAGDATKDYDSDGLTNIEEYLSGSLLTDSDTDRDGVLDGNDEDIVVADSTTPDDTTPSSNDVVARKIRIDPIIDYLLN